jgi:hypothetical protein
MNFRLRDGESVVLLSLRKGAPYADRIEDEGRVLIYEGHDVPRQPGGPDPKRVDQPTRTPSGGLTQNGIFYEAAKRHAESGGVPERVRVYEKLRTGIWVFTGVFRLLDAWLEQSDGRQVFKFRLELDADATPATRDAREHDLDQTRVIPTAVKLEVCSEMEVAASSAVAMTTSISITSSPTHAVAPR